jgi:membrane protein DedA with SNARE-associated domain
VTDGVVEWLETAFESWGYVIVGVGAMLENSVGVGLLVPGETVVLLGGFYAARGHLIAPLVALIAAAGQVTGDLVGYLMGRRVGRRILERPGRLLLPRRAVVAAERYAARHGRNTLILGRLVVGIRTVLPLLAGAGGMPMRTFVRYDVIGATLWAGIHTTLGYLIGSGYPFVRRYVGLVGVVALLALAIALGWSVGLLARGRFASGQPEPDGLSGSISPDDGEDH